MWKVILFLEVRFITKVQPERKGHKGAEQPAEFRSAVPQEMEAGGAEHGAGVWHLVTAAICSIQPDVVSIWKIILY